MKRKIFIIVIVGMIVLFTIMPTVVSEGAKDGLLLWFMAIVPSLLPFMILSNILIKLKVTKYINRFLKPVFSFIFGVSDEGSYPVLIGFLAGCPVGAKTAAQLYRSGDINRSEAQYLIAFCNNLSPMFLIEFIGVKCLDIKEPFLVFAVVAGSAVINAWLYRIMSEGYSSGYRKNHSKKREVSYSDTESKKNKSRHQNIDIADLKADIRNKKMYAKNSGMETPDRLKSKESPADNPDKNYPTMEAIDESIGDSCETILKIGGYIILFSIITSIIEYVLPEKYDVIGCVAAGITEVSTGVMQIAGIDAMSGVLLLGTEIRTLITVALCAFGGISSVAQTYSVISKTDISIKQYMIAKTRQAIISVILALLVFRI